MGLEQDIVAATTVWTKAVIQDALTQASGASAQYLEDFKNAFNDAYRRRSSAIQKINVESAGVGQEAALTAYLNRQKRGLASYRSLDRGRFQRYQGGRLARAISSPGFYSVTTGGVQFGIVAHLDKEARQWARINTGVGSNAVTAPSLRPVAFFGQEVIPGGVSLVAKDEMFMPVGFFVGSPPTGSKTGPFGPSVSAGGYFVPFRPGQIRTEITGVSGANRGIRGSFYMESGINALNVEYVGGIQRLAQSWLDEASTGFRNGKASTSPYNDFPAQTLRNTTAYINRSLNRL